MKYLLFILILTAWPVFAVQPDEILKDPTLELRAREISKLLRCPICQGETIDESNAAISRDLRLYVRERLVNGDTDTQVINAVTDRFGEFVLFRPRATGSNLILYFAGPFMALLAVIFGWRFLASRRATSETENTAISLSADERARLDEIMRK